VELFEAADESGLIIGHAGHPSGAGQIFGQAFGGHLFFFILPDFSVFSRTSGGCSVVLDVVVVNSDFTVESSSSSPLR
jgi:hypothetical protein